MKKLNLFGMALIAIVFASCGSGKQTVYNQPQQPVYQQQQPVAQQPVANDDDEVEIELYCNDEARSDREYFRELGTGNSINKQSARDAALSSAKAMLKERLGGIVKGISTDYSRTVAGQAQSDKVQRLMEREMTQVVDKMLNDADNPCEKMTKSKNGTYNSYYVIEVSKKELVDNFDQAVKTLSQNEELEIDYRREQLREYAKKYTEEMSK